MQTEMPFYESPEDALRAAVQLLGGAKQVGARLWPDKTPDAETVMKIEMAKEWCMNMAKIEARAEELHEGCRMPMEQARELAASEAGPDWYARGQDWGLADALTACQNGEWTLDDIARAFAAGAAACDAVNRHERQRLRADLDDYLRHVIDMTKGEHYFDVVRENAAALLKRLPSVLAHNVRAKRGPTA